GETLNVYDIDGNQKLMPGDSPRIAPYLRWEGDPEVVSYQLYYEGTPVFGDDEYHTEWDFILDDGVISEPIWVNHLQADKQTINFELVAKGGPGASGDKTKDIKVHLSGSPDISTTDGIYAEPDKEQYAVFPTFNVSIADNNERAGALFYETDFEGSKISDYTPLGGMLNESDVIVTQDDNANNKIGVHQVEAWFNSVGRNPSRGDEESVKVSDSYTIRPPTIQWEEPTNYHGHNNPELDYFPGIDYYASWNGTYRLRWKNPPGMSYGSGQEHKIFRGSNYIGKSVWSDSRTLDVMGRPDGLIEIYKGIIEYNNIESDPSNLLRVITLPRPVILGFNKSGTSPEYNPGSNEDIIIQVGFVSEMQNHTHVVIRLNGNEFTLPRNSNNQYKIGNSDITNVGYYNVQVKLVKNNEHESKWSQTRNFSIVRRLIISTSRGRSYVLYSGYHYEPSVTIHNPDSGFQYEYKARVERPVSDHVWDWQGSGASHAFSSWGITVFRQSVSIRIRVLDNHGNIVGTTDRLNANNYNNDVVSGFSY
ncbi:MAG: hypothetical protein ACQESP_13430, partial [Candidatus Muiribacteriota bacterium]